MSNAASSIDPDMSDPLSSAVSLRDREIDTMVARAIEAKEVALAYQPIFQANEMSTPAFHEAFLRVLDGSGRTIPARDFMPSIETRVLGRKLDCVALETGIRALTTHEALRLSINMSARSIAYAPWRAILDTALANTPTLGERLVFEITERSTMLMPDAVKSFIEEMQGKSVSFALDDYGTGYLSLQHLASLKFDMVKIDGSIIRGIAQSAEQQSLTRALIAVAGEFNLFTIAESVENADDQAFLNTLGVDCFQGFLHGMPTLTPDWLNDSDAEPTSAKSA